MSALLITGGNGLLGSLLVTLAGGQHRVTAMSRGPAAYNTGPGTTWCQVDLRDGSDVMGRVQEMGPDAVIHTAAMTDVDECERYPEKAWEANVEGTMHVARAARAIGAYFVLLSSDYVFPGDRGPYREGDPTGPALSVYGKTKLVAESVVLGECPEAGIARTSLLYGYAPHARQNFVTWLAVRLGKGERTTIVTDQTGSPTLVDNLAEMVLAMVSRRTAGACHAAGPEWFNRFEYAQRIAQAFDFDAGLLEPGRSEDLKQPARRPAHSGLVTERVVRELGVRPVGISEGLAHVRQQMGL